MMRCNIMEFLFHIFPIKIWQDYLIRSHLQKCSRCMEKRANAEDVRSLMQRVEREGLSEEIWNDLERRLRGERKAKRISFAMRWKWALSTACLLAAVALGTWIFKGKIEKNAVMEPDLGDQIQIIYLEVDNKPATPFLFRPQDVDMTIIWAGRVF